MRLREIQIKDIEAQAQDVLASYFGDGDYRFPVPIEEISKQYGLIVSYGSFEDDNVSGILKRTDGGGEVFVSVEEPRYRQNFTIAHELGHLLLHKEERPEEILYRHDTITLTQDKPEVEAEANWFAASLLMPEDEFVKNWRVTKDVSLLADFFGVSPTAVRLRLRNLRLE